ncbi:MAG: ArsR/SmtB family transcription factor [Candidatus Hodarchaeales archaeon]
MFDPSIDSIQRIINQENEEIAELLKASAHGKRLIILASLLDGRKSFPELEEITALSKTALANHLTQMVDASIICRIRRGSYELSDDGRSLLITLTKVYFESERYQQGQRELLEAQYARFRRLGDIMTKKEKKVSKVGIYQSHGISYPAAISGVLQALGEKWDVDDVTAFSGYGFLINTSKERICASGPTALAAWKVIQEATEKLGWQIKHYVDYEGFPSATDPSLPLSERDQKRARELFKTVKEAIDTHNRPVVIWGIPVPEYGIVNGYQEDYYLVSTFRTLLKQEETPIAHNKIQSPGCMEAFIFDKKQSSPTDVEYRDSLVRGLKLVKGEGVSTKGYASGLEAYDVLQKQLLETPNAEKQIDSFSFGYLVDSYFCGRDSVHKYLRKLSEMYSDQDFYQHLIKVTETYVQISRQYKVLQEHFPLFGNQDLSLKNRKTCAKLLDKIKELEKQAIADLEICLENWT